MPNPYGAPEIEVQDVSEKLQNGDKFYIVDVREQNELAKVSLPLDNVVSLPVSEIASKGPASIPETIADKDTELVVMCHHGLRSAQVTVFLQQQGWTNVTSMAGGVNAYATVVDPTIGTY